MERLPCEGIHYAGPPVDDRGRVVKHELRVGAATSLASLADEYAFFTPAALYLYGEFYDGPLIDFMCGLGREVRLCYRKPIFRGLEAGNGDADWNHALWAVRREDYQALADFIVSLTFMVTEEGKVLRFGEQPLMVLDPLALDRSVLWRADLPSVALVGFGVSMATRAGGGFQVAFRGGTGSLTEPPTLRWFGPEPGMVAFASAALTGGNPVNARSDFNKMREAKHARETGHHPGVRHRGGEG